MPTRKRVGVEQPGEKTGRTRELCSASVLFCCVSFFKPSSADKKAECPFNLTWRFHMVDCIP